MAVDRSGEFRVGSSWLPAACYIKQASNEGTDLLKNAKPLLPGALDVVISCNAGQLEGTVRNADRQPAPGARAVLVPNLERKRSELFKEATADKNGQYRISGIAPGNYKLYAWENLEPYSYFDPEVLKKFESRGQPVTIQQPSKETMDLTIIPDGSTP